jgi:hypothetical protein
MADKCLTRIEETLKKSSIATEKAKSILDDIKKAQSETKIQDLDETITSTLADEVLKRQSIQKKINKLNALEDEIKVRNTVEYVIKEFPNNPVEGLTAVLVGSNLQKSGSRASVALAQLAYYRDLLISFNAKLRENKVDSLFAEATPDIEQRVARVIWEAGEGKAITEKNKDIVTLGKIINEFSETVRKKYNDHGANTERLPGWIVRQAHDPFALRNAVDVLNLKNNKNIKEINGTPERNYAAWKDYILPKIDQDRTFANIDGTPESIDEFLTFAYNSLIRNQNQVVDGAGNSFGSRNLAQKIGAKRVLHFKSSDDWFAYNSKFGGQNLRESLFQGFNMAGRNIGMMSMLGSNPQKNFLKIADEIMNNLKRKKPDLYQTKVNKIASFIKPQGGYAKYMSEVDGSVNMINSFPGAKWSGIARAIFSMAKLGGATISAIADVHLYGTELKYQGRSYIGGVFEALGRLGKIKNSKLKMEIAEQLGFIGDNLIYDVAARYSSGDNLNKQFTKIQRTFFKLNGLSWWTNSLKDGAMLGMGNYVAKQRNLSFNNLSVEFKRLITHFGINEKIWNVIRKMDVEKADDGKEFFSAKNIDNLSDNVIKDLSGVTKMSQRQINIARDNLKTRVLGMFLDRSTYAVIEPDARGRSLLKLNLQAGTGPGEALRFIAQFKAFPLAIMQKSIGRELSFTEAGRKYRALFGVAGLIVGSGIFGYISMSAKDLLKGKKPRDPMNKNTFFASILQGGGLGIYTDFLFGKIQQSTSSLATLAGPGITEATKVVAIFNYLFKGEFSKAGKQGYLSIKDNIPFLNLFYLKTAFDYAIGYQMMETLSPGALRRMEKRMKDQGQEFLLTKPSRLFKGF